MNPVWFVVPCGGTKLPHAAPARDLYVGSAFRHQLAAAEAEAAATARDMGVEARVLILSAKYGLVSPDQVIEAYDVKMGEPESLPVEDLFVSALAVGIKPGHEVYAMVPGSSRSPYFPRLSAALSMMGVWAQNVYEAAPGIGYQRGVCSSVMRSAEKVMA